MMAERIFFETEKSKIKPQSFAILEAVGEILVQQPDIRLEIQGHLGQREAYPHSRNLSRDRAESVRKYFIAKKGIDPKRLEAKGYGAEVPLADWKTEEGRAKNRRIELVIWKWRGGTNRVMWPGP